MKLEVGKTYRTRDGDTVTITRYDEGNPIYPCYGVFNGRTDSQRWTAEGEFYAGETNPYDLIEEVQAAARPTPAMRQRAVLEAMDFRAGDKVVIKARIEKANGVRCRWGDCMQSLMDNKVVGMIAGSNNWGGDAAVCATFVVDDKRANWFFLPQCLEHYMPEPENIKLNDDYAATVFPQQRTVAVGCQHIDIDKVRMVLATWEKLNQ